MFPLRKVDRNDLLYRIADFIAIGFDDFREDEKLYKDIKKFQKKQNAIPLKIRIVIFVPRVIPKGHQKGFWREQFDSLKVKFSRSIDAGGGTLYKAEGFYKFEGEFIHDHHIAYDVYVDVEKFVDDPKKFVNGLKNPLKSLQESMKQDSLWVVINDYPLGDHGFNFLEDYEKEPWVQDIAEAVHDLEEPTAKLPSNPPQPAAPVFHSFQIGGNDFGNSESSVGVVGDGNHITVKYYPPENTKETLELQRGLQSGLEDAEQHARAGRPLDALDCLESGYLELKNQNDSPRINELKKRYLKSILDLLKKHRNLTTKECTADEYERDWIGLNRTLEIPWFEDIKRVVNTYSELRRFVDNTENKLYFEFLGEQKKEISNRIKHLGDSEPSAIQKSRLKKFCSEFSDTMRENFSDAHINNVKLTCQYFDVLLMNIRTSWAEKHQHNPTIFQENGYLERHFNFENFITSDNFSNIDKDFEGEVSLKAHDGVSISSWVHNCKDTSYSYNDEFEPTSPDQVNRMDEQWESLLKFVELLCHKLPLGGSGPRDTLDTNFVTVLRFCSATDTSQLLKEPSQLLSVVLEKYGSEKPWEKISRYENIKSRIEALSWKDYVKSECRIKDQVKQNEAKDTQTTISEWFTGRKRTLKIEAIGGLGKTAAVLEFIRRLDVRHPEYLDYNFLYLTAKSKEQGEFETNAKARMLGYKTKVVSNFNLGVGEFIRGMPFSDFLKRINSLAHPSRKTLEITLKSDELLQTEALRYLTRRKVIIFLDNFEDVEDDEREKYSKFFEQIRDHEHTKIIITTRPGRGVISTEESITIQPLNPISSSELFLKRYQSEYTSSLKANYKHLDEVTQLYYKLREVGNKAKGIFETLQQMILKDNPKLTDLSNVSPDDLDGRTANLLSKISDGSGHPLVLFYMVSMCLLYPDVSVCHAADLTSTPIQEKRCATRFIPTPGKKNCPVCGADQSKPMDAGFMALLYHLSLNEETGFSKANEDWEAWVTERSFQTLPEDGRTILRVLNQTSESLSERDLFNRTKLLDPNLTQPQFSQSLKFLKSQLIFLHVREVEPQSWYALKDRAIQFIQNQQYFQDDSSNNVSPLPKITENRLAELKKFTAMVQSGEIPNYLEFAEFNNHLKSLLNTDLLIEASGGTNPLILEELVHLCIVLKNHSLASPGWFNHTISQLSGLLSPGLSPEKKDWVNDLFVRMLIAAQSEHQFDDVLKKIHTFDLLNQSLSQETNQLLVMYMANEPPNWLYNPDSDPSENTVVTIFSMLGRVLYQPEFEDNFVQKRIIEYIIGLSESSDKTLEKINQKVLKKILETFTGCVEWREEYDDLYDRFVTQGYQMNEGDFQNEKPENVRRYLRINHDEFSLETLRSDHMIYLDVSGVAWQGRLLFEDPHSEKNFDLSFDRWCEVEKKYVFRITFHNHEQRILRKTLIELERSIANFEAIIEDNKNAESTREEINSIVGYLTNPDHFDSMQRVPRQKIETALKIPITDQAITGAIRKIQEKGVYTVRIIDKGDTYLETYRLDGIKDVQGEFIHWFEDTAAKKHFNCRGLPWNPDRVAELLIEWPPIIAQELASKKISKHTEWTIFAREIAQERFANNLGGELDKSEYSLIWKLGYYFARNPELTRSEPSKRIEELLEMLETHQTSTQRKPFEHEEFAKEQISKWRANVKKSLRKTDVDGTSVISIDSAFYAIEHDDIHKSRDGILAALTVLEKAGLNPTFYRKVNKEMVRLGDRYPMNYSTAEHIQAQTKRDLITLENALAHVRQYKGKS